MIELKYKTKLDDHRGIIRKSFYTRAFCFRPVSSDAGGSAMFP
jgi:hypothetical protein